MCAKNDFFQKYKVKACVCILRFIRFYNQPEYADIDLITGDTKLVWSFDPTTGTLPTHANTSFLLLAPELRALQ
jgi:hypothetical protein